ncbi:DUF4328 domain-containing protein [Paracoccus xiamenensis]|uniref:DUF4328 domain-containing protein n=1 Tax=Paracoccus xiamenensis TaxID=2714901 RepID=UPI001408B65C|nr:DUF4328 domain-containing protein [Paracoccus xiamenensis]NHF73111.1 DUF4328 domain-containing protein [Paracoccus xiamenensis]
MAADRYYDLTRLRTVVGVALLGMVGAELAYGVSNWQFLQLTDADSLGDEFDMRWAEFQEFEASVLGFYNFLLPACYLMGAIWLYRAARNAALLLPDARRISPIGALLWHLVPIASLFMPYRAMRQIHNSSTRPPRELNAPAPPVLRWWWGVWVVSSTLTMLAGLVLFTGYYADDSATLSGRQITSAMVEIVNAPLAVLAIWLWWQVVNLTTNLQQAARPAAPSNSVKEVIQ